MVFVLNTQLFFNIQFPGSWQVVRIFCRIVPGPLVTAEISRKHMFLVETPHPRDGERGPRYGGKSFLGSGKGLLRGPPQIERGERSD